MTQRLLLLGAGQERKVPEPAGSQPWWPFMGAIARRARRERQVGWGVGLPKKGRLCPAALRGTPASSPCAAPPPPTTPQPGARPQMHPDVQEEPFLGRDVPSRGARRPARHQRPDVAGGAEGSSSDPSELTCSRRRAACPVGQGRGRERPARCLVATSALGPCPRLTSPQREQEGAVRCPQASQAPGTL